MAQGASHVVCAVVADVLVVLVVDILARQFVPSGNISLAVTAVTGCDVMFVLVELAQKVAERGSAEQLVVIGNLRRRQPVAVGDTDVGRCRRHDAEDPDDRKDPRHFSFVLSAPTGGTSNCVVKIRDG